MGLDFGKTAADYARHRAGFPDEFFERVFAAGWVKRGDRLLDLGTGTGTVARGFALRGCKATGLDPAHSLLDKAREIDKVAGASVRYLEARAEETNLPAGAFEVVTAGQCWHWFDRPKALAETRRLLVPQGWLVIAHFDWLPIRGNIVEMTERLMKKHNPAWIKNGTGTALYPDWLPDITVAGFTGIETFSFDVAVPYDHGAWRGRIRASAAIGATLVPEAVKGFDADLAVALKERFPEEPLQVPHRVWVLSARRD